MFQMNHAPSQLDSMNLQGIVSNRNISALMLSRDAFLANDRDAPTLERAGFIFAH
jgi:hypothetical protein